ncbi:MAG: IS110 family transposase [Desulfobacterium sp.]|nr:IS110 family transposase [Desulfobacterium sp.]
MNIEETIRLERFIQLKREIRGSNKHLIVGIDIAKDKHHAFMGTATGISLVSKLIFDNTISGFEKLLTKTKTISEKHNLTKIVFGVEPTGNYHKPLGFHLIRCNYDVVLVSGVAVKRNRELLNGRWDKNDTKCAANVADLISQGKCLYYESPSTGIMELRELLSLRKRLKKDEHSLKMRVRNGLITKYFPELDPFFKNTEKAVLAIVNCCLDTNQIISMELHDFIRLVTSTRPSLSQRKKLETIYDLAIYSIGCPMGESAKYEAQLLISKLRKVREEINELEGVVESLCKNFPQYDSLLSIPGFGPLLIVKINRRLFSDYFDQVERFSDWFNRDYVLAS